MALTHSTSSTGATSTVSGGVGSIWLSPVAHQHAVNLARGQSSVNPNSDRSSALGTRSASMLGGSGTSSFIKGISLQAASVKGGLAAGAAARESRAASPNGIQHLFGQSSTVGGLNPLTSFAGGATKHAQGYTLGALQTSLDTHPKGAGTHLSLDNGRTSIEITGISHLKNLDFGK